LVLSGEGGVTLLLEAVHVAGPLRWQWRLTDADTGELLADHEVDLDLASAEAFSDLYGHARWHVAPDRRTADEARIVNQVGEWAGRELLGEQVGAAIVAAAPVTVLVVAQEPVSLWPLELAHVDGEPLVARGDVPFVYDLPGPGRAPHRRSVRPPTPSWPRSGITSLSMQSSETAGRTPR
jgi:hypothetical protein